MYTKNKKSIILLLVMNFIILGILSNKNIVIAADTTSDVINEEQIINRDELIGSIFDSIEYETYNGETIVVTRLEAERLERLKQEAIERKREAERQAAIIAMKTVESSRNISSSSINIHTDLSVLNTINADEINYIIDYWDAQTSTPFKGQGQVFIDAAKASGLDPIYILAHAGLESSWGNKNMSHNYFGIGAFDNNPSNGHIYGNGSLSEGIINGATWIARNYYNNGQNTLYSMRYNNGIHEYCTSDTWMYDIARIMQTSYSLINR